MCRFSCTLKGMIENRKKENSKEKGSAIIYILVAVALLGALSFAVSKGSRTNTSTLSDQQAKIAANEIISYGNTVAKAVGTLRLRGCTDIQISFENPLYTVYTNPSAPADKSCHVFDLAGGKVSYQAPDEDWLDSSKSAVAEYGNLIVNGDNKVSGIADAAEEELVAIISALSQKICLEINNKLGVSNPGDVPPTDTNGITEGTKFVGTYGASSSTIGDAGTSSTALLGKTSGCVHETAGCSGTDCYHFYQVLIAR